jgi:hypothetical protein
MKPSFSVLKGNHYSATFGNPGFKVPKDVYDEVGYDLEKLIKEDPAYGNTCAVRMSLALIKSGISFDGRMIIKKGTYKGRYLEPGAKLLADQLALKHVFGTPEIIDDISKVESKIASRKGVVFFNKIQGYNGGHIDIIEPSNKSLVCNSACYFNCKQVWFWPLN